MNQNKNFIIIAGESSGDGHGAQLMKNLRRENSNISFSGLGGPKMKKEGFNSLVPIHRLAVMGFGEVLKNIMFFFNLEKIILQHIKDVSPDKIILIDYPGFNLRIAKKMSRPSSCKVIYYISPQLWAWKENRIEIIEQYVDSLIVLFPFEVEWYKKRNIHVEYFGHPLVENNLSKQHIIKRKRKYNIALCPGSRQQEIKQHLPILIKLVSKIQKQNIQVNFEIFCADNIAPSYLEKFIQDEKVLINRNSILTAFKNIDFAIVASGTASLECAITLTPMVVIYKMSPFSWWITKMFIKTPFASIINILANRPVVLELLQGDLTVSRLFTAVEEYLQNPKKMQEKQNQILNIIEPLALKNVYRQTSSYIAKY